MKRYLSILLLLITSPIFAQEISYGKKNVSSFGLVVGSKIFFGDNFLAKTYSNKVAFTYDFNKILYRNFGVGIFIKSMQAKPFTTEYVGNSTYAKVIESGLYINYMKKVSARWIFIPKFGIASFTLDNYIKSTIDKKGYNYFTHGTSYYFSPEINYYLNKNLRLCANAEYGFIDLSTVNANSAVIGTNYNSANQLNFGVGIRIDL